MRDILVSMVEPSNSISDQYQASVVKLKDGGMLYGRVIYQNALEIAVASNPYDFSKLTKAPADQVASIEPSQVSLMPPATITLMNENELADLMAYLVSGGDKKHKVFAKN